MQIDINKFRRAQGERGANYKKEFQNIIMDAYFLAVLWIFGYDQCVLFRGITEGDFQPSLLI